MKTVKQLDRLREIHHCIKRENTGTPKEFANKLRISESQLYNILNNLKIEGFPIIYSRILKSYRYNDYCDLEIDYSVKLLTTKEKIIIAGGKINNLFTLIVLEWTKVS